MLTPSVIVAARPYPWPYHGLLHPARAALVVVLASERGEARGCAPWLAPLVARVRDCGAHVVWALRMRRRIGRAAAWPPPAATIGSADATDAVIRTPCWNAFEGSDLDRILRAAGADTLAFAGLGTELGIHSTMRRANDLGYECLLLEDACVPEDPALQGAALRMVEMSGGIFGAVALADEFLYALTAAAATSPAAALQRLVGTRTIDTTSTEGGEPQ